MASPTSPQPPAAPETVKVTLASGARFECLTTSEADQVTSLVARYQSDLQFTNISDLQDLDRVIMFETLIYRWNLWLMRQSDYHGGHIDERALQQRIKDVSSEVRQLKTRILGIDKLSRDRNKGEGSPAHYMANLLERAKRFGIHREQQMAVMLEWGMELIAVVQVHMNTRDSPTEMRELRATPEDIVDFIWDQYRPAVEAVDAYFRDHDQRFWIRDQ